MSSNYFPAQGQYIKKILFLYITSEQSEKIVYNSIKDKEFKRTAKLMLWKLKHPKKLEDT